MANKQLGRTLENLLVAKNRRLLEALTKLRVSWEDLSGNNSKSGEVIDGLESEVARQRTLNEKLENDLIAVNKGVDGDVAKDRTQPGTPAQGLAGLDIGGKAVSLAQSLHDSDHSRMVEHHLRLSRQMAIPRYFPLSQVSVIASVNAMLS